MIVWGSGNDRVDLGTVEKRHCEVCERERPFSIILQYRYWGVYWVFNFVTAKQYLLACDVCGKGWELEAAKVESELDKVPVPFMRRYGLLSFAGVIVLILLIGSLGSA